MFQFFLSVRSHPALFAVSCTRRSHWNRMRTLCLTLVIQELPYQGDCGGFIQILDNEPLAETTVECFEEVENVRSENNNNTRNC